MTQTRWFTRIFVGLFLLGGCLFAAPDCQWSGRWSNRPTDQADGVSTFKTNGSTAVPAPGQLNTAQSCSAWIVNVDVEGFSAVSVELDVAPSGAPGQSTSSLAWSNSTGLTTLSGSNPSTSTTNSTYLATGYSPWYRANVTTVTGTGSINVQVLGYRSQAFLSASGVGSLKGGGGPPTLALGTGAGSGGSPAISYFFVNGTNNNGTVSITTGSNSAAQTQAIVATVTFVPPYVNQAQCLIFSGGGAAAITLFGSSTSIPSATATSSAMNIVSNGTTGFANSTTTRVSYFCIGN